MPMLSLLHLAPAEAAAVPELTRFAREHPGVSIVTPHWSDEPWRAEITTGAIPGEGRATSGFLVADPRQPAELLRKLEKLFAGRDPEDEPG
jgi:hypothetical protein